MNTGKVIQRDNLLGLMEKDIKALQQRFGRNVYRQESKRGILYTILHIIREPMFVLLVVAAALYFILGKTSEGWMMVTAMLFIAFISLYQDVKSNNAVAALKEFTEPEIIVIRDGAEKSVLSSELVPGDVMLLQEGCKIPADARVIQKNDLSVNESVLTGESIAVDKNETEGHNLLYQGTTVVSGKCYAEVTAIGSNTGLGKLGNSMSGYTVPKTLLEKQIGRFIKRFAIFGIAAFLIIWLVNYLKTGDITLSLLFGLTLAMASIPEEIPVAFSSFMALGAYHMSKLGIISRQPQTVENLGEVSVICLDKTGTITENRMQVKTIYNYDSDELLPITEGVQLPGKNVLKYAMLASEQNPFDPMEKAIHELYKQQPDASACDHLKFVHEYPLEGRPPMMTHIYEANDNKIAAAKGAAERILRVCSLDENTKEKIAGYIKELSSKGYRVIAVAAAELTAGELPVLQDEFKWKFEGLVGFYDPPKKNIAAVFKKIYAANIAIKIITGDFFETAINIAGQVGMVNRFAYLSGEEVMNMNDLALQEAVKNTNIFVRMFPEAKLKVINALKANGEIVAMTGDGVNDAPALQSAHIGIAMGKKGTEMAREAADIVLTDDNLDKIVEAILQGRKIFSNFKKAVRYIISIHIPIILTASLPLIANWKFPNIFSPVHIIFLEMIMGPTCSVFFEKEPVEKNIMHINPRNRAEGLFSNYELLISIMQGLLISAGVLILYYHFMSNGYSLALTRTIVFTGLVLSNIFLTFTNRSFTENIGKTIFYKNNLALPVFIISVVFLCVIHFITPVRDIFEMTAVSSKEFLLCLGVAFASVIWFEVYKTVAGRTR